MNRKQSIDSAGKAIRALREEAGLTVTALADLLGWDKSRLSRIETDQIGLTAASIVEIAEALDKPPEVVLLRCFRYSFPESKFFKAIERTDLFKKLEGE